MTDPTPDNPLALFTFDELKRELFSRCHATLLVHNRAAKVSEPNIISLVNYDFDGGSVTALGLAKFAERKITDLLANQDDKESPE